MQVAFLAQGDQLFGVRTRSLGLLQRVKPVPFRIAHRLAKRGPQGLKPKSFLTFMARLKSCPDTKQQVEPQHERLKSFLT
jgi:hypothetical protein